MWHFPPWWSVKSSPVKPVWALDVHAEIMQDTPSKWWFSHQSITKRLLPSPSVKKLQVKCLLLQQQHKHTTGKDFPSLKKSLQHLERTGNSGPAQVLQFYPSICQTVRGWVSSSDGITQSRIWRGCFHLAWEHILLWPYHYRKPWQKQAHATVK